MKVISITPKDGINAKSHRKENRGFNAEYSLITKDFKNPITLRTYWTGGATHYACLWINTDKIHCSGSGSAGGGGYDKESAAIAEAIQTAGITLSGNIGGRGQSAIYDAITAIAHELEIFDFYIHKANA
jgi:hypothetical protein